MIVKLLTEHHLEFLSLTGDCPRSSESTLVKMANCWKSHDTAQIVYAIESMQSVLQKPMRTLKWVFSISQ